MLRVTFFLATLLGVAALAPSAQAVVPGNITRADLCRAWTASLQSNALPLQGGVTVKADSVGRVGANCLASNAELRLLGVKVQQDASQTSPTGTAASRLLAAVTHAATGDPDLKVGDELFYGAYIKTFNASLKLGYFDISGEIDVQWTGGNLSRFMFKGRLYGIDRFNATIYSPTGGTYIPNIGGTPVSYSGTLQLSGKKYSLNLTGAAPAITIGTGDKQINVTNGTIALNLANAADGSQHLHADVTGTVGIANNITANGKLSADFDDSGMTTLSGTGSVDAPFPAKGNLPAGKITGDATFSYTKDPLDYHVDFAGTVTLGDTIVTNATGTLDPQKITFKGDAAYTTDQLTATGAVEGVAFYGDDLSGLTVTNKAGQQVQATKGDYFIKTASGDVTAKGTHVTGVAQIGSVGTDRWVTGSGAVDLSFTPTGLPLTTVKGTATIDYLIGTSPAVTFAGQVASGDLLVASAKGSLDGKELDFSGDAKYTGAQFGLTGSIDGTVYYGTDLSGLTIKNHAGNAIAASRGDFVVKTASGTVTAKNLTVTGTASVTRAGPELSAKASGSVDTTVNTTQLKGSADVDWVNGQSPTVGFSGSVASNGVQVASATGTFDGAKIALKGNGTFNVSGVDVKAAFDGTVFYGNDQTGQTITNRAGASVQATKGDFVLKGASADITAKNLTLSGTVSVSKVGNDVWTVATGTVDTTYGSSKIKGSATVNWVLGQQPTVSFSGSITTGTTVIANASGALDGNKIAIKGDITYKDATISASGAVEGVYYYGTDLSGEKVTNKAGQQVTPAKGDWVVTKASGGVAIKDLDLTGGLTISNVGGQQWATASGSIDATYNGTHIVGTAVGSAASDGTATISFDGTVTAGDVTVAGKGTIDGKKITLTGTASMVNSNLTLKGAIDGTVWYGNDLSGETVTDRSGKTVQPNKGDFFIKSASADVSVKNLAVSGSATVAKVGSDTWVKGGGTVDTTYNGTQIKGSASVDWLVGSTPTVGFSGSVLSGGVTLASATGTLDGKKLAVTGTAQVTYSGYTVKGTADAVVYYGSDLSGETVADKTGKQIPASRGDFVLKSATADVTAQGIHVTGSVEVHSIASDLWTLGHGTVDATFGPTNIKGSADLTWNKGEQPAVVFQGTLTSGTTTVANAAGTLDGSKITLKGNATYVADGLTVGGAVDGTVWYGDDLSGFTVTNKAGTKVAPSKGDFVVTSATGTVSIKGLDLTGGLTVSSVGGDMWGTANGTVDLTYNGTHIVGKGSASFAKGSTPSVTFDGTFTSGALTITGKGTVDGKKIAISGTGGLTYNGITAGGSFDGVVYYGSDLSGETVVNKAGATVAASRGDIVVKSATAKVTAKGLDVTGTLAVSKVGSDLWAKGSGTVDATFGATNLKGSAQVDWAQGGQPTVAFAGTVTSGTTTVANASGTLDGAKVAIKGDVAYTTSDLTVKGAAQGVVYYGADLSAEKVTNRAGAQVTPSKGDFVLQTATGGVTVKGLDLNGGLTLSSVGGDVWGSATGSVNLVYNGTTIKGTASAAFVKGGTPTVTFDGSVTAGDVTVTGKGTIDGAKVTLSGTGTMTNSSVSVSGALDGTVWYGSDLSAEKVTNRAGAQVTPSRGDFLIKSATANVTAKGITVSGAATIGKVGSDIWVKGGGTLDATYNGVNVKGTASIDWLVGTPLVVNYSGAVAYNGTTIASATGTIDTQKITVNGTAQASYGGIDIKGTADVVVYYGNDLSGTTVTNKAGAQVQATKGDVIVKSASATISAQGLSVTGTVAVNKVGSDLWLSGTGSVDATYGATNLKGSATFAWAQGGSAAVTFAGTVTSGTTVVANASGTLDGAKIALKGDVTYTTDALTVKGAAAGTVYYGSDLSGEKVTNRAGAQVTPSKGDWVLKTASGGVTIKGLDLNGGLTLNSIGSDVWGSANGSVDLTYNGTNIKGSASADFVKGGTPTVTFTGSVTAGDVVVTGSGTIDGTKVTLSGTGKYTNANVTVNGALDGVVYYGSDLSGEKVTNRAGAQVTPARGDFLVKSATADINAKGIALSGAATIGKVGSDVWVKGSGTLDATYNGVAVKGSADFDWLVGTPFSVNYSGTVAYNGTTIASATGTIDAQKITLKGTAQASYGGIDAKGTVDAVVYYGSDLSGVTVTNRAGAQVAATKGDVIVKSATATVTAKGLTVSGSVAISKVGSDLWLTGSGSVDVAFGPTGLKGTATFGWAQGGTATVAFTGTVTSGATVLANASGTLDGAKIAIKGDVTYTDSNLTVKAAADGVVYYGSDLSGEKVTNKAGASVTPAKGDFVVKAASVGLTIKGLSLTGGLTLSSVGGDMWGTANGSVDLTYNGTNIKGTATATFAKGDTPSVSFDGVVTSGDTVVTGKGTIDGAKIALSGTATWSNAQLSLKGSVDATVYYGSDLSGEKVVNKSGASVTPAKGDFVIKSASAQVDTKGFSLTGAVSGGSVAGQKWVTGGGSVDLTWNGTQVKGSANVDWLVGQTPTVTFSGSVISGGTTIASATGTIDGAKIAIKGSAQITYSGITAKGTVDAVVYYGNDLSGEKVTNRAGAQVTPNKGDFVIKSATADITAQNLTVSGALSLSKVGSDLWATGSGSVNLTYNGAKLSGSATVNWVSGSTPSVAFSGGLTSGTTVVANATGTLDGAKIALKGTATVQLNGSTVTAAVDGTYVYGSGSALNGVTIADRNGNQVQPYTGDYNLKSASAALTAKGLNISGAISAGNVRGDVWVSGSGSINLVFSQVNQPDVKITGSASLAADGTVNFTGTVTYGDQVFGSASGTADGKKITFSAQVSSPTVSGKATGVVYYGDNLSGETLTNQAGTSVQATKGDFKVNVTDGSIVLKQLTASAGQISLNRVGTAWWIHAGANINIGGVPIVFTGDVDSTGSMLLKGSGTTTLSGIKVDFSGQATVVSNRLVISGNAKLSTSLFSVTLAGTIEKPDMNTDQYTFVGTAGFNFGTFQVANATVRLTWGEGLTTAFDIKTCFLFICPNATFKLYFSGGQIARAELNAPVAWVAQFLVIGQAAMPGVHIDTKITGII